MTHTLIRRALIGCCLLAGVWMVWPEGSTVIPEVSGQEPIPLPRDSDTPHRYFGVASCSSMACHNMGGGKGEFRSEHGTWTIHDQHTRAYAVLLEERSNRMVANLYPDRKDLKATEVLLCLKCHSTNDGRTENAGDRFYVGDGVGCEACHGPSEHWIGEHYTNEFQAMSAEEKQKLGFNPTKDLGFRTKLCASCHVGSEDKEVNHDLIAAGHPRLSFEMGGYHGIYEKHWDVARDQARYPDFQARLWAAGQIVAAREAIDLLRHRAENADNKVNPTPWPEFAEYECFACHQDIRVKGKEELEARYKGRRPGSSPWQTWYTTMIDIYAKVEQTEALDLAELKKLKDLMEESSPNAKKVAAQAQVVVDQMNAWLARLDKSPTFTAEKVRGLYEGFLTQGKALNAQGATKNGLEWDEASQLYLSLAAMNHGLAELRDPKALEPDLTRSLKAMRGKLADAFPEGYDSPRLYAPGEAPTIETLLDDIFKAFKN